MHLTRRQDLLDLDLPPADLTPYEHPNPISPNHEPLPPGSSNSDYLKLPFLPDQHDATGPASRPATLGLIVEYLRRLIDGEYQQRRQQRRRAARQSRPLPGPQNPGTVPAGTGPRKSTACQVQNLFRLEFLAQKANVIFLGNVGLGKTHLATALGYAACLEGHSVLFANAIDVINDLERRPEKRRPQRRTQEISPAPALLILDEIGYLPIDQHGADLLFQVISQRYERGSIVLTTNKPFKQWPSIFNNDSTITSAVLDRLLHHAETVVIEGTSYRMKDQTNA